MSSINCNPIVKTSENNSDFTQIIKFSNYTNNDESNIIMDNPEFKGRTLSWYSMHQIWIAEGEMKVAFLKFLIFKLQIMIKLVSQIFGLTPYQNYPYNYIHNGYNLNPVINPKTRNPNIVNPSERYNYQHHNQAHNPYNHDYNDLHFNLMPNDLNARSRPTFKIIKDWFFRLGRKLTKYFTI